MRRQALAFALIFLGCPSSSMGPSRDASWSHPDVTMGETNRPLLEVFVTDELRGQGLPCKLTVRGTNGTRDPSWGPSSQSGAWIDPASIALANGRWVLMARGRAALPIGPGSDLLAPGTYRLTVSRGTEYATLDLGEVTVGASRGAVVTGTLRRVVETEGEIAGEFHVHSAPSFDSDVPLDQRVLSLAVEGVEVFASTDHDTSADFSAAIAALDLQRHVHWVRGNEITANGFGHFNVFPLPESVVPERDLPHLEPSVAQIVARAREVVPEGIIQLNHPMWNTHAIGHWSIAGFDPSTGMARMEIVHQFDTVEIFNSHSLDEAPSVMASIDSVIDAWMTTIDQGLSATATGNTDTHRLSKTPPGWPRTYLRVPSDDPATVTDAMITSALRAGDAMVTSGAFVRATIMGRRSGQLVTNAGPQVVVTVDVQGPEFVPLDRVEVYANHVMVAARDVTEPAQNGARRQRWDIPIELTRDAWVVVRTRADQPVPHDPGGDHALPLPSIAFTNPIFLDVDRDQRWTPPGPHTGP